MMEYLDNYVQNIHRSCSTNISISNSPSFRSRQICKRKQLYDEGSEFTMIPKRICGKHSYTNINKTTLSDTEIEQQFGERLLPTITSECTHDVQCNINS